MPASFYAPRLRAERLIAVGRAVLGASSLLAIWADPSEPANYASVAYGLLVAYLAYAGVTAAILWRAGTVWPRWPVASHVTDLIFFSLFIFFTEGPAGPFTTYFVFALVSATLRWRSRGTFWTAVATLGVFLGFGVYFGGVQHYPAFDLQSFIIRGVYMCVIAFLLGYLGAHEHRALQEMWQLASWPPSVPPDVESLMAEMLGRAGPLLGAPRAVLVWAEPEAPRGRLATWDRGRTVHERAMTEFVVAEPLRDHAFLSQLGPPPRTVFQDPDSPNVSVWEGDPLDADFTRRFASRTVVSVPLRGEGVAGRLFFLDKTEVTLDDLLLAEVVAGYVASRLEVYCLLLQLRQAAATEERMRLARDLHDGVLQSLTGVGLRLAGIHRVLREERPAALGAVEELQRVLAAEQRDLRFFIQDLKPQVWPIGNERTLHTRLTELSQRMEREWELRVALSIDVAEGQLPAVLGREVYLIVREALVNAARHGGATSARVTIASTDTDMLAVTIADNGRGFSFSGRYTSDDLIRLGVGPKTLRERVLAIHGSLTLESASTGAALHVTLPRAA